MLSPSSQEILKKRVTTGSWASRVTFLLTVGLTMVALAGCLGFVLVTTVNYLTAAGGSTFHLEHSFLTYGVLVALYAVLRW